MIVRIPYSCLPRWARSTLVLTLVALPLYPSCTSSEDTEPYVPAVEGAKQPGGGGDPISEDDACTRLKGALEGAYDRLSCDAPALADCPEFLRPGGGSGCYEYDDASVSDCEQAYSAATSCRTLSPCFATATLNIELPTCEQPATGEGGAGGASAGAAGAAGVAGAPLNVGGTGAAGDTSVAGNDTGGVPAVVVAGAAGMAN